MRYLDSLDAEVAAEILRDQFPGLEVRTIAPTPQGMDNITFVVNDELIFRFPRAGDMRQPKELWVLRELWGKTSLPIPNPEWVGTDVFCMGYRMLPGVQVEPHLTTATAGEKAGWIMQLVDLMADIHTVLSVKEAQQHGVEAHPPALSAIDDGYPIQPEYLEMAEPMLERYQAFEPPLRVIHYDLHCQNLLFDPDTRQLTGAIDFGDVSIADPAIDLGYLLEIDIAASETISARYELRTGLYVDPQRIIDLYYLLSLNGMAEDEIPEPWFVRDVKRTYDYLCR